MSKNIFITGASRGIGRAIALELAGKHNLFLTARDENKLALVVKETGAKGFCICDLSKKDYLDKIAQFVRENSIDILINNAGEYVYGGIDEMNYEKISQIYSTNLLAPAYLSSVVVENMKSKKWGRIINIGSISGIMGEAYASLYSSSKAGLIGLTKALALELAEFGITVNTINPGWVETELGLSSIKESDFSIEETLTIIPQKRFVKPEEVAKLVEYLITDSAKGVTGQSINLCAGLSLGI